MANMNPHISTFSAIVFLLMIAILTVFLIYSVLQKRRRFTVQRYYMTMCSAFIVWLIAMIGMWFTPDKNQMMLWVWDSMTYFGAGIAPVSMLIICICIVKGDNKLSKKWLLLYIVPAITVALVWTNPLHHLMYANDPFSCNPPFSIVRSQIETGPYLMIQGVYTYLCLFASIIIMIAFAIRNNAKIYRIQAALLSFGALSPLAVSIVATLFPEINMPISATPLSFTVLVGCNYLAIYLFHILDIVPVAKQHVLDLIQDGYLIMNEDRLVIDSNKPFRDGFGALYGIEANKKLDDCAQGLSASERTVVYNLVSNIIACAESNSPLSYEQIITVQKPDSDSVQRYHYMIDITPLEIDGRLSGFAVIFKDITQIKNSMLQVQESRNRLMEQERLAMLGQMVGGLAHNLKTPIMNVAGCSSEVERLIQEISESLGDESVTVEDYREIVGELYGWTAKIRESCSYMSDVITAIKGQAAGAVNRDDRDFRLDDAIKSINLLMKHELQTDGCMLVQECKYDSTLMLHGDMNGLIQVVNNLISNAIFAEKNSERKVVYLSAYTEGPDVCITVRDTGTGISPEIKNKLFNKMITTKGNKGTGLGLYISSTIIRSKFGGDMWCNNNPEGGAIFGVRIPIIRDARAVKEETQQ